MSERKHYLDILKKLSSSTKEDEINIDLSESPKAIPDLFESLKANPFSNGSKLISLKISKTKLRDKGVIQLVSLLKDHPMLESMDVSWNEIGSSGAKAIAHLLNSSKISQLNLDVCTFHIRQFMHY